MLVISPALSLHAGSATDTSLQVPAKDSPLVAIPAPAIDTAALNRQINSGLESMMYIQREQQKKARRSAIIRIGFGVGMLALLIIGLQRRKRNR